MKSGLAAGRLMTLTRESAVGSVRSCRVRLHRDLELLANLVAAVTFDLPSDADCHMSCSAVTDNRGISFVVSRLLITKFPLCAFLMELALQLHSREVNLDLYLLPRLQNAEADELTNNCTVRFDPRFRVRFDLQKFKG